MAFKTQEEMNKYFQTFKKIDGTKIENVAEYIDDYILKFPDEEFEIFIGTDSQKVRKRNLIWYSTVICIYRKGKGAHLIYTKEKRQDIVGIKNRLKEEVNYSIGLAVFLRDNEILYDKNVVKLHLDLSPEIENESNKVLKEMTGWVKGMGFEYRIKPESCASSYAADMCVRMN